MLLRSLRKLVFDDDTDTTMADQPRTDVIPLLPDDAPLPPADQQLTTVVPPRPDDAPLPIDVSSHADTMKFAEKIDPFDPTGDRTDTQLKFRRYVHTIALRSPKTTT